MGDLLQQGSQWLGAMLKEHASSPVTYRRADTELELQATFGRTEYEVEGEYGLRILDGLSIDLADGLNCLIGHRGTGKTTVLEFVRYALDEFQPGEAGQLCRRRVETLVKRSLGDGRIRLAIQTKDGLEYIVDRTASGDPLVLTADGEPTDITISSSGIFSADIFS